jgi:hypothetical protein
MCKMGLTDVLHVEIVANNGNCQSSSYNFNGLYASP